MKRPSPPSQNVAAEFVRVGQIVGAHGLKGQVKVELMTDFPERLGPGARLRLDGDWVEVKEAQFHKNRLLLKLFEVKDRTAAEALQWKYLEAKADRDVELDEDEYFTEDLIGLQVQTVEGEALGAIDEVLAMPAHDVLVVGKVMIPVVREFIKDVDLDAGRVTVQLIEGMRE